MRLFLNLNETFFNLNFTFFNLKVKRCSKRHAFKIHPHPNMGGFYWGTECFKAPHGVATSRVSWKSEDYSVNSKIW